MLLKLKVSPIKWKMIYLIFWSFFAGLDRKGGSEEMPCSRGRTQAAAVRTQPGYTGHVLCQVSYQGSPWFPHYSHYRKIRGDDHKDRKCAPEKSAHKYGAGYNCHCELYTVHWMHISIVSVHEHIQYLVLYWLFAISLKYCALSWWHNLLPILCSCYTKTIQANICVS